MPMSMARRNALVAWARKRNAWIIEDDYDSELRYAGHPFPSLQGLDPDRVIYLGPFSKILFSSLCLGYAVVPEGHVAAFLGARTLMDRHCPSADQPESGRAHVWTPVNNAHLVCRLPIEQNKNS